ncbi:MAG: hypothetical protein GY712_07055 [Oceanicoccus sp.]|uniref:hypothetical protein n=1 Tax=Oceanicoccus sp. TaxID=2691044 RepID=UPI0026341842|nr:hypothetical protein [Oceanicoccus sp.]MCP3907760.1 hypothetical protein [Oceanicoccus sp.]
MKKLFFTRLASIAALTTGLAAHAANELAIQTNLSQEDNRSYSIIVDGKTESVPASGVVTFDLVTGEYEVQLLADGAPLHQFYSGKKTMSFPRRRESRLHVYAVISAMAEIYSTGFPPSRE